MTQSDAAILPPHPANDLGVVFQCNPVPMLVFDVETLGVLAVNDASVREYGYSREEFLSLTLAELRPPEDLPLLHQALAASLRTEGWLHHARHRRRDGSLKEVEITGHDLDFDGRPARLVVAVDVTGRNRTATRLRALQEVTASLAEAITLEEVARIVVDHGVAALDARAGSLCLFDAEAQRVRVACAVGYEGAVLDGWQSFPLEARVPAADAVRTGEPVFLVNRAERERAYPHLERERSVNGDGALACVPLRAGGRVVGALGVNFAPGYRLGGEERAFIQNLAQQCAQALHRAGLFEELSRARDEAHLLAEASRTLASSLDYAETLRTVARLAVPALADWCAVDILGPDGRIERVAVHHDDPERLEWALRTQQSVAPKLEDETGIGAVLRSGETTFLPAVTPEFLREAAPSPEHERVWTEMGICSVIMVPMRTRERTLGAITFIHADSGRQYSTADVVLASELAQRAAVAVENARLFRETEEASRTKSQFLAVVSHELRTPLNAIIGYLDLLEVGVGGPLSEKNRQYVGRVMRSSRHLLQLIEEILTFSRTQAGYERLALAAVEPAQVIRESVQVVEPLASAKGLELAADLEAPLPPLHCDPDRLRQIVVNLLGNAVRYTPAGFVRLELEHASVTAEMVLRVRDSGIGIEQQNHELIFEPFWQERQGLAGRRGGTGLGLSIARDLARLHGGDITLESAPGEGSTFTLRLPLAGPAGD